MKALKGFRATDISLMVLLFFHAICAIITGTLLPQIIKEFSIDYATAGSIETLRSYAILFILVITVKLLRVVSAKTLFVLSRFGIAVGFVMSVLSGNYSFFLAGVILAGLGAGFVESLIAQTITNLHQAENNTEKFFNAIQGVFSIAVILIPLLYGYAMEHGVTWRQIFLYTSIMPVVVAFILLFSDLPAVEAEEGGYSEALKAVFSKAAGRLLSIGIFVSAGIENMFYVWSATYISLYLHDNQQYAATGLAIFGLFMCLARFTSVAQREEDRLLHDVYRTDLRFYIGHPPVYYGRYRNILYFAGACRYLCRSHAAVDHRSHLRYGAGRQGWLLHHHRSDRLHRLRQCSSVHGPDR